MKYYYNIPMKKNLNYKYIFAGLIIGWIVFFNYFWDLVEFMFEWAIKLSGGV